MGKGLKIVLFLVAIATVIIVSVIVWHILQNSNSEVITEKVEIEEDQMMKHQRNQFLKQQQTRAKSTFSPEVNHGTSNHSTISESKSPFQVCTEQDSTINQNTLWSVKMGACTGSVGTPLKGVIENWDTPDVSMNYNKQQFELLKSGHFEIKEKGYYEIFLKITFQATEEDNQYSMIICESDYDGVISIKFQNGTQRGDKYEIISKICGNVTQKLKFHVDVPKVSQIYLYPALTFVTVTKSNND